MGNLGNGTALNPDTVLQNISTKILNPLIVLMFAVGILVFFWGVFQVIYHADDEEEREKGRNHMIYGVIGIFIMVAVNTILSLINGFVNNR